MTMLGTGIIREAMRLPMKELSMTILADRLKTRRNERGLTQRELADVIGIKQSQYARYEKGSDLGTAMLARIARALECSADYLVGLTENPSETVMEDNLPPDQQAWLNIYKNNPNLVREFRRYLKRRPLLGPGTFFFEIPAVNDGGNIPSDKK